MTKYTAWWQGVGEICIGTVDFKSHKEARKYFLSQIVIRKGSQNSEKARGNKE